MDKSIHTDEKNGDALSHEDPIHEEEDYAEGMAEGLATAREGDDAVVQDKKGGRKSMKKFKN